MLKNVWFDRNMSQFIGERSCLSITLTVMAVKFHIMEAVDQLVGPIICTVNVLSWGRLVCVMAAITERELPNNGDRHQTLVTRSTVFLFK